MAFRCFCRNAAYWLTRVVNTQKRHSYFNVLLKSIILLFLLKYVKKDECIQNYNIKKSLLSKKILSSDIPVLNILFILTETGWKSTLTCLCVFLNVCLDSVRKIFAVWWNVYFCIVAQICYHFRKKKIRYVKFCVHVDKGRPRPAKIGALRHIEPWRVSGRYLKPQRSEREGLPLNLKCNSTVWKPTWMSDCVLLHIANNRKSCLKRLLYFCTIKKKKNPTLCL